jgi:hypothetical protein
MVIPTYNHKRFVCQAIDACLAQTYPNCEIIVVDDGSTDATGDMLRERYGDRIGYIYQENRGLPVARNVGTRAARGEFIHYCDADDQLLPTKVEQCAQVLIQQPDVVLVYTDCHYVEEDGQTIIPRPALQLPSGDVFCELLTGHQGNFIAQCTPLIRRQAVLDVGGFNEQIRSAHDWDLWLRLAAQHQFAVIHEALALYRVLPNAMHTDPLRMSQARLAVIQMARHYPGREKCLDDSAYDQLEAGRHHRVAIVLWLQHRRAEARRAFREAIRLDPSHTLVRRLLLGMSYVLPARLALRLAHFGEQIKAWVKPQA